jgi:hypothetical protein
MFSQLAPGGDSSAMNRSLTSLWLCVAILYAAAVAAQRTDAFVTTRDHPAINYSKGAVTDRVAALDEKLRDGTARLTFDAATGYLRSTLDALSIPVESQVAVFAQNSFQAPLINMKNPRTLFFNDSVALGYVRGGTVMEVAALDPRQGVIFYTLDQTAKQAPRFARNDNCLACHLSWTTLGVPGYFVLSMQTVPEDKNAYASGFASDHRTGFDTRWGGWYVTGALGGIRHIANRPVSTASTTDAVQPEARELKSLAGVIDTSGYLSAHSDAVALMVLEHQTHMANLIVRLGWETRLAEFERRRGVIPAARPGHSSRVEQAASDLVDYLLFVDEAPLPARIRGSSAFAEKFAARGPLDSRGRSLRQFDLERRLMRYPCSYMIYSDAFEALPSEAKHVVYRRLSEVLSGRERNARYASLSSADRQAVTEILRDTKMDLPPQF